MSRAALLLDRLLAEAAPDQGAPSDYPAMTPAQINAAVRGVDTFVAAAAVGPFRNFRWNAPHRLSQPVLLHYAQAMESLADIAAHGFREGVYAADSHFSQGAKRADDRQGPFAYAWKLGRPMAKMAAFDTGTRYGYGRQALVLTSERAVEAFNHADNQWQCLFERAHFRPLAFVEMAWKDYTEPERWRLRDLRGQEAFLGTWPQVTARMKRLV